MLPPHQLLIRVALAIQSQYESFANRPCLFELPHAAWQESLRAAELLEHARRRRWSAAGNELTFRVRNACNVAAHELTRIAELLKPRVNPRIPALRELYSELVALYDQYEHIRIDRRAGVLAVTTDPIVLEDMTLGPFEIRLRWSKLPDPTCYSILALEPNPSRGDGGYVHPHVLNERLCEGEGRLPIQRALADGRLCDFFEIVTCVLQTYNSERAYLPLEHWHGVVLARRRSTRTASNVEFVGSCASMQRRNLRSTPPAASRRWRAGAAGRRRVWGATLRESRRPRPRRGADGAVRYC